MNRDDIITLAESFVKNAPENYITEENATHPDYAGMKIYEAPIFAFGSADDELYITYKSSDVIGSHFLCPVEWMPSSGTVISFFLPFTDRIKAANATDSHWPADEWMHGRYEGQIMLAQLLEYLVKAVSEAGYKTLAPSLDARYITGIPKENNRFTSSWSERHVAYVCGLGTFGLSKGIITKKGMSGRLGSLLTELDLPKDGRDYSGLYDYCIMCGTCAGRCPVHAISLKDGKKHLPCSDFLDRVREKHNPRYGCGKCQVGVPCESRIPAK